MARTQNFGIKFPFNIESEDGTFLDLCHTPEERVKSEIMHVIFTPVGQRLRDPNFGTCLIQYIYDPNDAQTWEDVKHEIKEKVSMYVPQCSIEDLTIYDVDDGLGLMANIKYTVDNGTDEVYEIITTI